jgi:hypothetical protein
VFHDTTFLRVLDCYSQELEGRARSRYDCLAQLRTDNGWLEYRLRAVRDALLDQGVQTVEDGSAVDILKARATLAEVQTAAAERETTLTMVQAQLQQDHATLEGPRSWQTQA